MKFKNRVELWQEQFSADMRGLYRAPRDKTSFATVIIDAVVVNIRTEPAPVVRPLVSKFKADWHKTLRQSGYMKRGTRYHGMVEIDLLTPKMLGGKNKRQLLTQFGVAVSGLKPDERVLLIHYHTVVDATGHPDGYRPAVAAAFPGSRRVHVQPIYETGTVVENLRNLADYMTKMRLRYSEAYEGLPTKFYAEYEPEWHDWFRDFMLEMLPDLTVSTVRSRAVAGPANAEPECPFPSAPVLRNPCDTAPFEAISPAGNDGAVDDREQDREDLHETLVPEDFQNVQSAATTTVAKTIRPDPNDILARIAARVEDQRRPTKPRPDPHEVLARIRDRLERRRSESR